ncbi:MAG: tetraprenyl-beta-curcumene synthase family protein [Firmicutes bacterium]|nr:tetraprenyl-beta-curcumene synthase family protein [Bacillota bacterium]
MNVRDALGRAAFARRIALDVLPRAAAELGRWQRRAAAIPNSELRRQAGASIAHKRFHAEGGSVFAALRPEWAPALVPLIVALQTISDYLDNLCDRSVSRDEADFRRLHQAMLDAVDERGPLHDYYALHPNRDDGGYLEALIEECRRYLRQLPGYPVVRPRVKRLVQLYSDLQVYKHGPAGRREPALAAWFQREGTRWPELRWWEFAAACGSTLGMFALFAAATRADLVDREADRLVEAYFPWICGLHILLDYLIDQAEDSAGGDLNLVSFYRDEAEKQARLLRFVREARARARAMPDGSFHENLVQGLPGLYLSDGKVKEQRMQSLAWRLLKAAGPASFGYFVWCRLRRYRNPAPPQPAPV